MSKEQNVDSEFDCRRIMRRLLIRKCEGRNSRKSGSSNVTNLPLRFSFFPLLLLFFFRSSCCVFAEASSTKTQKISLLDLRALPETTAVTTTKSNGNDKTITTTTRSLYDKDEKDTNMYLRSPSHNKYKNNSTNENRNKNNDSASQTSTSGNQVGQKMPTIVGGSFVASEDLFPWIAILYEDDGTWVCGASLVAPDMLITAAHCRGGVNSGSAVTTAQVGIYDRTINDGVMVNIVEYFRHPGYDTFTLDNDIMVLQIDPPVTNIRPVTINIDPTVPPLDDSTSLKVIGFGSTETVDDDDGSTVLKQTTLKEISTTQCLRFYDDIFEDRQICAFESGTSPCDGDSGTALLYAPPAAAGDTAEVLLVGVMSFVSFRGCVSNAPSGFTRVSGMVPFLQDAICGTSISPPLNLCPNASNNDNNDNNNNNDSSGVPVQTGSDPVDTDNMNNNTNNMPINPVPPSQSPPLLPTPQKLCAAPNTDDFCNTDQECCGFSLDDTARGVKCLLDTNVCTKCKRVGQLCDLDIDCCKGLSCTEGDNERLRCT